MSTDGFPASRGGRRWRMGLSLLVAALALCVLPGVADAKKKRDKIGVATFNLYLGSDLGPATAAGAAGRTDLFADEVGFVVSDVDANNFDTRAKTIAKLVKKRKVDLLGLQEAALWKVQIPTDGTPLNPASQRAGLVTYDYTDRLLDELNKKAKTKKECAEERKDANKTPGEKDDRKAAKCYRGYKLVVSQQEADVEFFGDFDHNNGPDGVTFDVSNSAAFGAAAPAFWLQGNDDTGQMFGEPPAAQCSDGVDNDATPGTDWGGDPQCTSQADNSESVQAQCSDGVDNEPDTFTDGADPECDAGPGATPASFDNSEATDGFQSKPSGLPQDTNFDSHAFGSSPGAPLDPTGNGRDGPGEFDCTTINTDGPDSNPAQGPTFGEMGAWPFAGYDGDINPNAAGFQVPVCLFHGIDGDASLTMRDAILARKGFGVKTKNSRSANFSNTFAQSVFGGAQTIPFKRGWTATDARIRGKRFTFVNTHLESENQGSIREDQAAELVAPGGPATASTTVLVGDLNSDPNRPATNLPNGDGGSNIAINRLFAAGFVNLAQAGLLTGSHGDHGDVINDPNDTIAEGWIDHILTNNPSDIKRKGKAKLLDRFANGLWTSDHAGLFLQIKGKKRNTP